MKTTMMLHHISENETCHVVHTPSGALVMVALAGCQIKKIDRNQPTIRQMLIGRLGAKKPNTREGGIAA